MSHLPDTWSSNNFVIDMGLQWTIILPFSLPPSPSPSPSLSHTHTPTHTLKADLWLSVFRDTETRRALSVVTNLLRASGTCTGILKGSCSHTHTHTHTHTDTHT